MHPSWRERQYQPRAAWTAIAAADPDPLYLKVVKWGTWGQKQNANLHNQRLQSARGRARVARKPCSSVGTAQNFVPNVAGSSLGFAYFLGCRAPFELRSPNVDIEKCWELKKS